MNTDVYGRTLIGDSLGFHILFALLGVGIPLLMLLAELVGLWRHDKAWLQTAEKWSRVLVVLFVAGAVSGSIISIQFSAVWPKFMAIASQTVGISFFLEGFAFIIETLFLGLYILSWRKWSGRWIHWIIGLPMALAAATSAFFITTVNAWMNSPQGFQLVNGKVTHVQPFTAIFNHATATETSHSMIAYYLTTTAVFAAWYAWRALKDRQQTPHQRQILNYLVGLLLVLGLIVGATGDASAKYLAHHEPIKLAAIEGLFVTRNHAPLQIGGYISGTTVHDAIRVPGLLSWLALGSTDAAVKGLNTVSPEFWPPLYVHDLFDTMVGIGILLVLIPIAYFGLRRRKRWHRPLWWLIFATGPLAAIAVEAGWMVTEIGRQPYAIRGVLLTSDAITTSPSVIQAAAIFPCLYVLLLIVTIFILLKMRKLKWL